MRRTVCLMSLVVALLGAVAPARADAALPPVKHIFTIVLENQDFAETFLEGQALAAYTTRTLPLMGALVPGYWGTGHSSLDNYIAMVSGQGPNVDTQGDCNDPSTMGDADHPSFSMDARGQAIGKGCMYPPPVKSIADQLDRNGLTWKGYMEDMAGPCKTPGDGSNNGDYKTKHNPFVYFHSTTDRKPYCDPETSRSTSSPRTSRARPRRRTSRSSFPTSATTATTTSPSAATARWAASCRSTRGCSSGCRRS
jgi:hypothetical protein